MPRPSLPPRVLRSTLAELIGERPSRNAVAMFLGHSLQIATAYLRRRLTLGRLRLDQFDLSVEDLALDCLADLFRRNDEGAYVRLQAYAASIGWEALDDAETEGAVRRLVFSVVNEGLFRRYRESDPTISRYIRTLKRHVKRHERLVLYRERTTLVVALRDADPAHAARPRMTPGALESYLHDALAPEFHLREAVADLARRFAAHPEYAPKVPLPELALCIRNVLTRRGATDYHAAVTTDDVDAKDFSTTVHRHVGQSLTVVQQEMQELYVENRGLAPSLYRAYFRAVDDILTAQFAEAGRPDASFRTTLNRYIDGVSSREYRQKHQAVLEYLVNLTKRRFLKQVEPLVATV